MPLARLFGVVSHRFLGVAYDGRVMLGIVRAAEDFGVHDEVLSGGGIV